MILRKLCEWIGVKRHHPSLRAYQSQTQKSKYSILNDIKIKKKSKKKKKETDFISRGTSFLTIPDYFKESLNQLKTYTLKKKSKKFKKFKKKI